jgi:hypothetical protein
MANEPSKELSTVGMFPKPTPQNTINLSEYRKRFVAPPTDEQISDSKRYYKALQALIAESGTK